MATPQQPELARSRRSAADPASAKSRAAGTLPAGDGPIGPVPEDNLPGHRPEHDQDKPEGPPRRRPKATRPAGSPTTKTTTKTTTTTKAKARPPGQAAPATRRFGFAFETTLRPLAAAVGVRPENAWVELTGDRLVVRFGRWSLETELANVAGAERTGPYAWYRVAGPPRLSLADRGVTFATTTRAGVCIRFHRPITAIEPLGVLRHPAATVTVEDPDALVEALTAALR